jgi:hypothetical protein
MPEPDFTFTIPPVACLFGERAHITRLFKSGWEARAFIISTVLLAADAAARAIDGRASQWQGLEVELGTPEHQAARAALHAFLMSTSPGVVAEALWRQVEKEQRRQVGEHDCTYNRDKDKPRVPYVPTLLVLHLDNEAEFVLVQKRASAAIAVEVVDRHPASEGAQPREGWPTRCTRIGSQPDLPSWAGPENAIADHQRTWAELARQRVMALAANALATKPEPR